MSTEVYKDGSVLDGLKIPLKWLLETDLDEGEAAVLPAAIACARAHNFQDTFRMGGHDLMALVSATPGAIFAIFRAKKNGGDEVPALECSSKHYPSTWPKMMVREGSATIIDLARLGKLLRLMERPEVYGSQWARIMNGEPEESAVVAPGLEPVTVWQKPQQFYTEWHYSRIGSASDRCAEASQFSVAVPADDRGTVHIYSHVPDRRLAVAFGSGAIIVPKALNYLYPADDWLK